HMRETEQPLPRNVQSVSDPHLIERRGVLAFNLANEERKARVNQPHRKPRVGAQFFSKNSRAPFFLGETANANGARGRRSLHERHSSRLRFARRSTDRALGRGAEHMCANATARLRRANSGGSDARTRGQSSEARRSRFA